MVHLNLVLRCDLPGTTDTCAWTVKSCILAGIHITHIHPSLCTSSSEDLIPAVYIYRGSRTFLRGKERRKQAIKKEVKGIRPLVAAIANVYGPFVQIKKDTLFRGMNHKRRRFYPSLAPHLGTLIQGREDTAAHRRPDQESCGEWKKQESWMKNKMTWVILQLAWWDPGGL